MNAFPNTIKRPPRIWRGPPHPWYNACRFINTGGDGEAAMSERDEVIGVGSVRDYFKKWEYKIVTANVLLQVIKINGKRPELPKGRISWQVDDCLNELGDQGWEMVSSTVGEIDGSAVGLTFVMKRHKA
jgi:hypothetical protein